MLIGALLLLFGFGGIAVVGYATFSDRARNMSQLDRRLGMRPDPVAAPAIRLPNAKRALTIPQRFAPLLARAEIEPTPQMISILAGVIALSFSLVFALAGLVFALIVALVMASLPLFYLRIVANRRTNALIDALPFYIDGVRQLMSVGNSLPQALMRAMSNAAEPIQTFLGPAARRIELGAPIGESLQQLADRLAVPELSMLAAAVRTNLRFGGSMSTILTNLSLIMRERIRINRELSSATAEVKISTQMLIAIPLCLIALLFTISPIYRTFFFNDPRGHHMAIVAAVLQGIGMVVMSRLKRLSF